MKKALLKLPLLLMSIFRFTEKERKIQLCITVLETLGKVDPGYTKWRGTLLQELIHPIMLISKVR